MKSKGKQTKIVRKTGIGLIGNAPWGTHFCQFYQTKEDLIDILVPYFKAGLENNEFCLWVTSEPLEVEDATRALKKAVKNLDDYIKKGQIEILDYSEGYTKPGKFEATKVLRGWVEKENQAVERGFDGLRLTGNTFWLGKKDWENFTDYEEVVNKIISKHRMLAICTYSLDKCGASEIIDVVSNHQFALIRREGKWELIESSERKKAEEALRKAEEKFRTIFENSNDVITYVDKHGKILDVNKRSEDLLGYKRDEIVGKNFAKLSILGLKDIPRIVKLFTDTVIKGKPMNLVDLELKHKNGNKVFVEVSTNFIKKNGKVEGVVNIYRDITERKKLEEELHKSREKIEKAYERLKELDTMKNEFLSIVSHELRTPLTPIQGYLDLLESGEYGELNYEQKNALDICLESSNHLKSMIDNLVEITRLESGKSELIARSINLTKLIDQVLKEFKPMTNEKNIRVIYKRNIPPSVVKGNKDKLRTVISNLVDNAIKFTPNGGSIWINVEEGKRSLHFRVKDSGKGITKEHQSRIFDKFYQVDVSSSREFGGIGLGLAICKEIIELHGGRIWVKSKPGEGSEFHFNIPTR